MKTSLTKRDEWKSLELGDEPVDELITKLRGQGMLGIAGSDDLSELLLRPTVLKSDRSQHKLIRLQVCDFDPAGGFVIDIPTLELVQYVQRIGLKLCSPLAPLYLALEWQPKEGVRVPTLIDGVLHTFEIRPTPGPGRTGFDLDFTSYEPDEYGQDGIFMSGEQFILRL